MPVTRVIILPGNGAGDVRAPGCNWYAWMERTLKKEFGDEVHVALENMPDPVTARRELWLPFTREKMGADEHTVVLGHSSGAVAAVRLAEETKLYGIILVGVCHTDLGDANERASNYYPLPDGSNQWRWEQAVANTNFVSIFASADDPFLPYSEQEHVRDQLCKKEGSKFFGFPAEEGRGHWQDEHQKEILQHTIKHMAFVTRSKRNDNYGQSTSGPDVGPGTYSYDGTTNGPGPKMGVKYSIPPFGSSCEREISTSNAKEFLTPGPGYYSGDAVAPPAAAQTNMSSQFASKSTRLLQDQMLQKKAFTPGPGSYSFTEKWADPKPPQPTRAQSTVSWAKVATAPSIPAPSQSFGYEEGSRGELIQGKPPPSVGYAGKAEDGAGPGAYTPDDRLMRAKAPSLDFGKSKTTRTGLLIPKEVAARPGPGAYDMGPADSAPKSTVGSSVFASATTRQFIAKNTGLLPGPGAYNTTSSFRTRAQAAAAAPQVAATAALPVHTQRVKGTPGPGHYQLSSDFDPKQERARGDKSSAGFLSTALRFCGQVGDSQRTPGPGYYSDGTCTNQNMSSKLAKRLTGRYGVFGTTSQRFGGGRAAGDPGEVPADTAVGPCSYDPPRDVNPSIVRRRDVRQAVFVSNVKRLNDKQDEATPGVGAYEVGGNLSTEKRSHQARSSHFLSNDVRFKPTKPSTVPGPGEYVQGHNTLSSKVVGIDVTDRDGSMRRVALGCTQDRSGQSRPTGTKSLRFPESKTAHTPGPGYYDSGATSLLKRTFNITIGDSWD